MASIAPINPTNSATPIHRELFATVGATAPFVDLLTNILSIRFLKLASSLSFTHITLQCGASLPKMQELIAQLTPQLVELKIEINAFDFSPVLIDLMKVCKSTLAPKGGRAGYVPNRSRGEVRREGVVVTHAGAGTILDALRLSIPLIVVPNPSLLDNHQVELARELDRQGYVVSGEVDGLNEALQENEKKSHERKSWLEDHREGGRADLMGVVDEVLGYPRNEQITKEEKVREMMD